MGNWKRKEETSGQTNNVDTIVTRAKRKTSTSATNALKPTFPKRPIRKLTRISLPRWLGQEERKKYPSRGFYSRGQGANVPLLYVPQGTELALKKSAIVGASSSRTTWLR